jgi:hypothetical protein
MSVSVFLLALGAVARLTRLLNSDVLAAPFRTRVERRFGSGSRVAYLMTCPWCASIWIAPPVVAAAAALGGTWWFTFPAACLTVSYVYGLTASLLDD